MGIQINGQIDDISATDGGLTISDLEINQSGISTFNGTIDANENLDVAGIGTIGSGGSGQAILQYQGSTKLTTLSWGVSATGTFQAIGNLEALNSSSQTDGKDIHIKNAKSGGGVKNVLTLSHASNNSSITGHVGNISINAPTVSISTNFTVAGDSTFTGAITANGGVVGDLTGNADTATTLATARNIGGVSFNGSANIDLPGVNSSGNQDTTGNAATATALETARTIGGTSFDGTANIVPAEATNADTVDSLHASSFIRSDADDSYSGTITANSDATNPIIKVQGAGPNYIQFASDSSGTVDADSINFVYRSTPNSLAYERASDDTILFSVDADDAQANFGGDVSIVDKIIHTGDTNTAIRFPANDTITAETGGSERFRIDSNGNIGVNATPRTSNTIFDNTEHFLVIGDSDTGIAQDGDGELELWANNEEIVNLNTTGVTFTKDLTIPDKIIHSGDANTAIRFPANDVISFETVGVERARFTSDGLCLGGTGSANGLDDYEEGTFTPSYDTSAGDIGSVTYDARTARYIKVGRLCFITIRMRTDNISNVGSGTIRITGLPFTHVNQSNGRAVSNNLFTANWTSNDAPTQALIQHNQTYMNLYQKDYNNDTATLPVSAFNTGSNDNDIRLTAVYETT